MPLLPPDWSVLEPHAVDWALPTSAARAARRNDSTQQERQAFYDAVSPHAAAALAVLDGKLLGSLSASEKCLLDLLLTFAHISLAVEVQGDAEAEHARWRARMTITQSPADAPS